MKVFPSAVARDDPNFTCGAAAVLISYIQVKQHCHPAKWPRRSANNCLCLTYSIKQAVCVSPGEPLLLFVSADAIFWDWSYAVTPTLRTCQESQEQRRDEWGWVKSLNVDAGRATARTKELPQQRRRVKRPRRCGTFTLVQTRLLACRSCNCHTTNVHGGVSPQWLALAFTAMKMCSRGHAESQKWLQPPSATSKCLCDFCSVTSICEKKQRARFTAP